MPILPAAKVVQNSTRVIARRSTCALDRRLVRALSLRHFSSGWPGEARVYGGRARQSPLDTPMRYRVHGRSYSAPRGDRDWERLVLLPAAACCCMGDYLFADPRTGEAPAVRRSRNVRSRCRCSVCPAIHINSRSWLRSSSTHEPSDPPHRVVSDLNRYRQTAQHGLKACALAPEYSDPETSFECLGHLCPNATSAMTVLVRSNFGCLFRPHGARTRSFPLMQAGPAHTRAATGPHWALDDNVE